MITTKLRFDAIVLHCTFVKHTSECRNTVNFTRRLEHNIDLYESGDIPFAEMDAPVQGWVNHVPQRRHLGPAKISLQDPPDPHPQKTLIPKKFSTALRAGVNSHCQPLRV